jgi:drug/metabolite transporter (DMT)-like permease
VLTVLALVLAVLGASCYAVAARLQHEAVRQPPSRGALVRRPRWLAGLLLLGLGGTLHVSALRLAPVTVVQPLGVTGVVVSVVWGLRQRRRRPDRGTLLALAAVVAGTAAFAVLAARVTVTTPVTVPAQLWAGMLVLSAVCASAVSARLLPGRGRCMAWALGAGCAYGCVSVLARAAGEEVTAYGAGGVLYGTLAGLALAGLAGFWLAQRAQATSGSPSRSTRPRR